MQIVSDFRKPNMTQEEPALRADLMSPSTKSDSALVTTTTVEENNKSEVESILDVSEDETKTEMHSSENRTEILPVDHNVTQPAKPSRFVVAQFLDSNGNPCAKEVVMTAEKKTYYVYTCEERSLPLPETTTLQDSDIHHYRGELQTTTENVDQKLKGLVTTPMAPEDQTLPEMLNDYVMYNKQ